MGPRGFFLAARSLLSAGCDWMLFRQGRSEFARARVAVPWYSCAAPFPRCALCKPVARKRGGFAFCGLRAAARPVATGCRHAMGAPSKKLIFPFFSCAGSYRVPVGGRAVYGFCFLSGLLGSRGSSLSGGLWCPALLAPAAARTHRRTATRSEPSVRSTRCGGGAGRGEPERSGGRRATERSGGDRAAGRADKPVGTGARALH